MFKRITLVFMFMMASCAFMPATADGQSVIVADELVKTTSMDVVTETLTARERQPIVTGEDHALIAKDTNSLTGLGKETDSATAQIGGGCSGLPYEVGWRSS